MSDLILDSLEIQNFRAFRHLKIERLGRVNLITGKNNVGKTCLLEAVTLYAQRGAPQAMVQLLVMRGDLSPSNGGNLPDADIQNRYSALLTLFHAHKSTLRESDYITIGQLAPHNDAVNIKIARYTWSREAGVVQLQPVGPTIAEYNNVVPTLELQIGDNKLIFPLDQDYSNRTISQPFPVSQYRVFFVPVNGLAQREASALWDMVSLTEGRDDVLAALGILAPNVRDINYISTKHSMGERIPAARVKDSRDAIPLHTMGEGMNRLLGITLALVNATDAILLIDEVEIGLHYSVLPDMWRLIFEVSRRLNVQVFATTHSWDCIRAFQEAASDNTEVKGELIRLTNRDGNIVNDIFTEEDLRIVTGNGIEVR